MAQVLTHVAVKHGSMEGVEMISANGRPALMRVRGDEEDMIFTLRLNPEGKISWIYTQRNPEKLAASVARGSGIRDSAAESARTP